MHVRTEKRKPQVTEGPASSNRASCCVDIRPDRQNRKGKAFRAANMISLKFSECHVGVCCLPERIAQNVVVHTCVRACVYLCVCVGLMLCMYVCQQVCRHLKYQTYIITINVTHSAKSASPLSAFRDAALRHLSSTR